MKNKKLYIESLLATILVFLLMAAFAYIPFNLKIFNPLKESLRDFKFTDLYYSQFREADSRFEDEVILVNIGDANREEIGMMLQVIDQYDPSVIGMDIIFEEARYDQGDSILKESLEEVSDKLVMISLMEENDDNSQTIKESDPFFGDYVTGYANFVGNRPLTSTIRYFRPKTEISGSNHEAFGAEIIKKYNPEKYETLLDRQKNTERINFIGNRSHFPVFDQNDLVPGNPDLEILKDKIVILGFLGNKLGDSSLEDRYFSPLNEEISGRSVPDIYGVVIHANILSMILNDDYINKMGTAMVYILAFLICYIHVIFFMYFFIEHHMWYHLFAKLAQLITSIILLFIVFKFFSGSHYEINSAVAVFAILLSVDVLYLYENLAAFAYKKWGIKSYFIHEH